MIPRYYTTAEVADICKVKPNTVRIWKMQGRIKPAARTVGGHLLFLFEDFIKPAEEESCSKR